MRPSITRDLETADALAKLVLASATILLWAAGVIAGPFAVALVILSVLVVALFLLKAILRRRFQQRNSYDIKDDPSGRKSASGRAD